MFMVGGVAGMLLRVVYGCPDGMPVRVEQYTAPRWPDPAYPQQIHLDVTVQDVDAAERAALDIGATRLDGAGPNWCVYADPAGKPFCLVWTV
jgi:hypothetical protein